jgi:uncharacterized coiled-coil DUF342 family protein
MEHTVKTEMTTDKRAGTMIAAAAGRAARAAALFIAVAVLFAGCGKEDSVAEQSSPESYMNDEAFRKEIADFRKRINAVAAERREVADRMQAIIEKVGEDAEKLGKIAEWSELKAKITELNAKYVELRKEQQKTTRERIAPRTGKKN